MSSEKNNRHRNSLHKRRETTDYEKFFNFKTEILSLKSQVGNNSTIMTTFSWHHPYNSQLLTILYIVT